MKPRQQRGAKAVTWDWEEITSFSPDYRLYALTEQQQQLLLTVTSQQANWETRWFNRPSSFQNVKTFVAQTGTDLMTPLDICQLVADCIRNNPDTRVALEELLQSYGTPNNNSATPLGTGAENLLQGLNCDFDTIYGVAVAIEDYVFASARDSWEVVTDTVVDAIARARLLDYFPIIGDLPVVDDINDLITQIRAFGLEAFEIGYTAQQRQDNICAIFNLGCSDCILEASDVAGYYASEASISYDLNSQFEAFIAIILGGTYTERQIVAAWMALVASILSVGGGVLGRIGIEGFRDIARSGDPDGDWAIFCDPCSGATVYNLLATATPYGLADTLRIPALSGQTVTVEYVNGLWGWNPNNPPSFDGDGDPNNNAPGNSVIPGQPLASLIYSPRPDSLGWVVGGNDFSYTMQSDGDVYLAFLDAGPGSYADNQGSINVRVIVT